MNERSSAGSALAPDPPLAIVERAEPGAPAYLSALTKRREGCPLSTQRARRRGTQDQERLTAEREGMTPTAIEKMHREGRSALVRCEVHRRACQELSPQQMQRMRGSGCSGAEGISSHAQRRSATSSKSGAEHAASRRMAPDGLSLSRTHSASRPAAGAAPRVLHGKRAPQGASSPGHLRAPWAFRARDRRRHLFAVRLAFRGLLVRATCAGGGKDGTKRRAAAVLRDVAAATPSTRGQPRHGRILPRHAPVGAATLISRHLH
jgi:hypothetical protein